MKKLLINITIILISLIIPISVHALSTTNTIEKIDLTRECSLTLNYKYNNYNFDNNNVEFYYIASITSDFKYQLSSEFSNYPIQINGLKTDREWTSLEQTISSYIEADHISNTISQNIKNNLVKLSKLRPGLYFIKTEKMNTENYTLSFDSFLLSIPNLKEDGTWNYDVSIYPKTEEYIPKYEKINYTVIKEWNDNPETRPTSIEIEIYKDGTLINNQTLSSSNNWTYTWTTADDGSTWTVIERNIPTGYNLSIQKNDQTFILINTNPNYKEENPKTLDKINIYFYLFISSTMGIISLIISLIIKKRQSQ